MNKTDDRKEIITIIKSLLEYFKMDILAMVKILECL
jgi:hypothetical protein